MPGLYRDGVLLPASPIQFSGIDDPALPVQRALDKERVFPRRDMVALMVRPVPLVGQKAVLRCGPRYGIYLYGRHGLRLRLAYPNGKRLFPVLISAFRRKRGGIEGTYQPAGLVFYPNGILAGSNAAALKFERDLQPFFWDICFYSFFLFRIRGVATLCADAD